MALKLITAPAQQPVTLAEAKAHLRVDSSVDDTLIESLIKAATLHAENFTGRAIIDQVWDYYLDEFPADGGAIKIPKPPLVEVSGVFYSDGGGVEQTLPTSGYVVDPNSEPARLVLPNVGTWPTITAIGSAVRVRFRAGYYTDISPADEVVPHDIKVAILLLLGTLYENRETIVIGDTVVAMPWSAEQLLRFYRIHTAIA